MVASRKEIMQGIKCHSCTTPESRAIAIRFEAQPGGGQVITAHCAEHLQLGDRIVMDH